MTSIVDAAQSRQENRGLQRHERFELRMRVEECAHQRQVVRRVALRALASAARGRLEVVLVLEVAEGRLAGIDASGMQTLLDGTSLGEIPRDELRRMILVQDKDPALLSGTLRQLMDVPRSGRITADTALEMASADDVLDSLVDGGLQRWGGATSELSVGGDDELRGGILDARTQRLC